MQLFLNLFSAETGTSIISKFKNKNIQDKEKYWHDNDHFICTWGKQVCTNYSTYLCCKIMYSVQYACGFKQI